MSKQSAGNRKLKLLIVLFFALIASAIAQESSEKNLWQPYYISPRTTDQHISLDGQWQLGYSGKEFSRLSDISQIENWFNINVPGGTVHWALYRAGKLPNMYEHLNSKLYEWVEDSIWYYRKSFDVGKDLTDNFVILAFDGIDYFSKVWLNGEFLGNHQGMFGGPAIEVSNLIKDKGNELIVEVRSGKESREKQVRNPRNVIKGWEFTGGTGAEPFFTVGMWQGARLEIVPKVHLERPFLITKKIEGNKAFIQLKAEVFANKQSLDYRLHPWSQKDMHQEPFYGESLYNAYTSELLGKEAKIQLELVDNKGRVFARDWSVELFDERSWINHDFVVEDAKLWWPNGMGTPNLYTAKVSLIIEGEKVDEITFNYGIRTIETTPSAGPQVGDFWDNWQFVINGKPIFVKGVNWMPADVLLDLPAERYEWLVSMAKNAGVQLFRIWGSGLIETEEFYNACNKEGIMVWGEYSMANWDAPDFPLDVFESQILWSIFRLRNHPSLAVHCGGNEYNAYSKANSALTGILERSVEMFDGTRPYRRSSPDEGSIHTYQDMDPNWYPKKYKYVPYIAESGMHSITEPESLYEIINPDEFKNLGGMYNDAFKNNHPEFLHHFVEFQADRIPRMVSRASHINDMSNPTLEEIAEASQVGAGEFYQIMSDLTQANYAVTTGLMPWVFKRPWPVVSAIHLVDGFGQPSAPYYFLKRTYEPTHLALNLERLFWKSGESIKLNAQIMNSGNSLADAKVSVTILDDKFDQLSKVEKVVTVQEGTSVTESSLGDYAIPVTMKDQFIFIVAELQNAQGELVSRSIYFPRILSKMDDPDFYDKYINEPIPWITLEDGPWLKPQVAKTKTKLNVEILSNTVLSEVENQIKLKVKNNGKEPAFMTKIDIENVKRNFYSDDNYFWLSPGEEKIITLNVQWREPENKAKARLSVGSWTSKAITTPIN